MSSSIESSLGEISISCWDAGGSRDGACGIVFGLVAIGAERGHDDDGLRVCAGGQLERVRQVKNKVGSARRIVHSKGGLLCLA